VTARGDHVVLGLAEGIPAAEKMSALTGRELVTADDPIGGFASVASSAASCVISAGRGLTSGVMRHVARSAAVHGVEVGYLYGWAGEESSLRHAERTATYRQRFSRGTLLWSEFGGLPSFTGARQPIEVVTDGEAVPEALRRGHRLVCIESHGNGVDAPLGSSYQLCARRALTAPPVSGASLPCLHGGPCIRSGDGRHDEERQVSPAAIAADVMVWATCWGVLAADAAFDPAASIARVLALDAAIGAILTTTTAITSSPARLLLIASLLRRGASVGAVATRLNRIEDRGALAPWLVVGDPLSRAYPVADDEPPRLGDRVRLEPGLFTVRMPDDGTDRSSIAVTASGGTPSPAHRTAVFMTRFTGERDIVGLHLSDVPAEYHLRPVDPATTEDGRRLRELWRPLPDLRFAIAFLRWARHNPYAASVDGAESVGRSLETALARRERLAAAPLDTLVSGDVTRLARLRAAEERTWRRVVTELADYLRAFATAAGGVLSHTYSRYGLLCPVATDLDCPYCGTPVLADRWALPSAGPGRDSLRCPACANIADTPPGWGSVEIVTPERISAGETRAELRLRPAASSPPVTALASLTLQPVPFAVLDATPVADLVWKDDAVLSAEYTLHLKPGAPTGMYYLTSAAVVDGSLVMGRRPVFITGTA
jgi:hypothetical protein